MTEQRRFYRVQERERARRPWFLEVVSESVTTASGYAVTKGASRIRHGGKAELVVVPKSVAELAEVHFNEHFGWLE